MNLDGLTRFHNCLYLGQPNTWVSKDGECLVVQRGQEKKLKIPVHHLSALVCFAPVSLSGDALGLCLAQGVNLSFLSYGGKFQGRLEGVDGSNVLLRRCQFRAAEAGGLTLARNFVLGKIKNMRLALMRAQRNHGVPRQLLGHTARALRKACRQLEQVDSLDSLRGVEGAASRDYFAALDPLFPPGSLRFERRSRRPPLNAVNAMLSFGYGLLRAECVAALQAAGLDPAVGFLHTSRPGRPALALDLMEEFRPGRVDRFVMSLVNRKQAKPRDFLQLPNGAVRLKDAFRKKFLEQWQQRKADSLQHPFLKQQTDVGMVVHLQARLLARCIRGDLDAYPPFLWR